jgi:hypothetical protein
MAIDTLVLKIEEVESNSGIIDSVFYVFFDNLTQKYCIRGSRRGNFYPYSFTCDSQHDVSLFVEFSLCIRNRVSYTLINYGDLPFEVDSIDFNYLEENFDQKRNEIVGYDKLKLRRNDRNLRDQLRLLRVVYNEYDQE